MFANAQTLRPNSGINAADTYLAIDVQELPSATIPLSTPLHDPTTNTQVNSIVLPSSLQRTLHFESGYDTDGNIVANMYIPTPAQGSLDVEVASVVRYANGQLNVYDANGAQLPIALPTGISNLMFSINLLGSSAGGSIASQFVTSNIQATASRQNGQLTTNGVHAQILVQPTSRSQVNWSYAQNQQNGTWVAQSVTVTPQMSGASMSRTLSFTNVVANQNAAANAARAKAASTRKAAPAANANNAPALTNSFGPAFSCNSNASTVGFYGGTDNIDFQHGFTSNPCTWSRMVPWLDQDFIFGTQLVSKTDATSGLALQGQSLIQQIQATNKNNFIFVGHSAGGLVARYAAQQLKAQNNPVHGVATLNTPHQGADAALTGPIALAGGLIYGANALADTLGCYTAYDNIGCYVAALIATGAPAVSDWAVGSIHALNDFTPGSSFLSQLNGGTENFTQAAVIGQTPQRWLVTRQMDEIVSGKLGATCNPEDLCGERNIAALTELFYEIVEFDFYVTVFELFDCEVFDYCDPVYLQIVEDELIRDFEILGWMDVVDYLYRFATAPNFEGSDGLVQFSSQYYPSVNATQLIIKDADSHGGATKSDLDHAALYSLLKNQFGVRTIASCTYSVTPQTVSASSSGGTLSFSLTTQPGCPWTAVSNQSWVSVNSPGTGSSNGTISLAVQANPFIAGRNGTISLGDGTNSAVVAVVQAGASTATVCTYSLSPSGLIALPNGGGSGTVTVTTSTGCMWSATSNSPWLSISSNGTGTGPGTFQYTAGQNTTTADLIATVTVANQQLNFIEGTAGGGPSTGTVTVSGGPQYGIVRGCQGQPGCPTIAQGGAIQVTIDGANFYASFSNSGSSENSLSTVVQSLVDSINGSSFVRAVASGSKITITSIANGAATNYTLSIGVNFDTADFSTPAYTAVASGSALTGGH